MANIILFSHGQLATGLADSCKLIIGENHFKVLNILLDQNIQTAIKRISDNKLLYVVTGMNLGLVMSLSFLSLSQDDEDNKNKIRDAIEESQKGIYLVNDVISCNDELSDDDDL